MEKNEGPSDAPYLYYQGTCSPPGHVQWSPVITKDFGDGKNHYIIYMYVDIFIIGELGVKLGQSATRGLSPGISSKSPICHQSALLKEKKT